MRILLLASTYVEHHLIYSKEKYNTYFVFYLSVSKLDCVLIRGGCLPCKNDEALTLLFCLKKY